MRYTYGVSAEWRKKSNWTCINNIWIFEEPSNKSISRLIPLNNCRNFQVEPRVYGEEERPNRRLSSPTRITEKEMLNIEFVNPSNLDLKNIPYHETPKTIIVYPCIDKKTLGFPTEYLQTPKNGACFYSGLSFAFVCSVDAAEAFRKIICDYMQRNKKDFSNYVYEPMKGYIAKHRNVTEYADFPQVIAAACAFDVTIGVMVDEDDTWNFFAPKTGLGTRGCIFYKLIQEHYMLVVNVQDEQGKTCFYSIINLITLYWITIT